MLASVASSIDVPFPGAPVGHGGGEGPELCRRRAIPLPPRDVAEPFGREFHRRRSVMAGLPRAVDVTAFASVDLERRGACGVWGRSAGFGPHSDSCRILLFFFSHLR